MFSIFQKKPSKEESINNCIALAKKVFVQAVAENGDYSGFVVILDSNESEWKNYFTCSEVPLMVIKIIDERIRNEQFK